MFTATVERTITAAHHNGPEGHKCNTNHGHDWRAIVTVEYGDEDLNANGWGPDFGAIKAVLDRYDHQDLNELLPFPPSAENFAKHLYREIWTATSFTPSRVELYEGHDNRVAYTE